MNLEQQLRETYVERLGALDLPGGDPEAARRDGARMRMRRRLTATGTVAAVVAVAAAGTLIGTGRVSVGPSHEQGHWREAPAAPLSPRAEAQIVWTGHEVIVLGGETKLCPPNADCAFRSRDLRDGAAYDPEADAWHRIADAPVPVGPGDRLVAAGGQVVLRHWRQDGSDWFGYDPAADDWSQVRGIPKGVGDLPSALGSSVFVTVGKRVAVYSLLRDHWTLLPEDPIRPALAQRRVTATDAGPVVTGVDSTRPNDGLSPSVVLADVWDGSTWRRLPATGQLDNNGWFWTGSRMVDPAPFTEDGGESDSWGRAYPNGGILDPDTGAWTRLPAGMTDPATSGWAVNAQGGGWSATYGQVYDTDTGRVWTLPRPDGAPDYGVAAAWADGRLVAFGGADRSIGYSGHALTNRAWIYTP
jgi:hypothetical protein